MSWMRQIPLITRSVLVICIVIYILQVTIGFGLGSVCIIAWKVLKRGQIWRLVTAPFVHAGLLHVTLNMLTWLSIGSSLERSMGSFLIGWIVMILVLLGNVLYVLVSWAISFIPLKVAFLGQLNPATVMHQCAVGYSGVLFGLLVIENKMSRESRRSIFGFFSVPAPFFPVVLLILWQLLVPRVSFLGHLTGLLVGELYCSNVLNKIIPSSEKIQTWEESEILSRLSSLSSYVMNTDFSLENSLMDSFFLGESNAPSFGDFDRQKISSWFSSLFNKREARDDGMSGGSAEERSHLLGNNV